MMKMSEFEDRREEVDSKEEIASFPFPFPFILPKRPFMVSPEARRHVMERINRRELANVLETGGYLMSLSNPTLLSIIIDVQKRLAESAPAPIGTQKAAAVGSGAFLTYYALSRSSHGLPDPDPSAADAFKQFGDQSKSQQLYERGLEIDEQMKSIMDLVKEEELVPQHVHVYTERASLSMLYVVNTALNYLN